MTDDDFTGTREPWRRWFAGPARRHDGDRIESTDLAVVVIGYRAEENLAAAVASLRAQQPAEIVVVNSGGGAVREKLAAHLDHIRLIEIDAPLLVGAARNIGIDASHAPYVAFLAGDCVAAPGWVAARLAAHRDGARAVASAVAAPEGAGYWTSAAYLLLFGTRSPQVPTTMAKRYGASYDRRLFAEAGYFNPALRIGEDSELAQRLGQVLAATWTPSVVTIHRGPETASAFLSDLFERGRRAARHQIDRRKAPLFIRFPLHFYFRNVQALRLARDTLRLPAAQIMRLCPALWLGAFAYVAGVQRGFLALDAAEADLRRSRRTLDQGDLPLAIALADRAVMRNGEDVPTLLHLADLLRRDPAESARLTEILRRVAWLSAFAPTPQLTLCDWLLDREMFNEAAAFAELCKLGTPHAAAVHLRVAEASERRRTLADGLHHVESPIVEHPARIDPQALRVGGRAPEGGSLFRRFVSGMRTMLSPFRAALRNLRQPRSRSRSSGPSTCWQEAHPSGVSPDIPPGAIVLLDFIGETEAPAGYGVIYRNRQDVLPVPLTEMTLHDVLAAQPQWKAANGSSAAGRYQVIDKTLLGLVGELGLDPGLRFDARLQDRLGLALLRRRGFDHFAAGEITLPDFALALAQEWAAFPVLSAVQGAHRQLKRGETFYAGDGRNRALVTPRAFTAVLEQSLAAARAEAARRA